MAGTKRQKNEDNETEKSNDSENLKISTISTDNEKKKKRKNDDEKKQKKKPNDGEPDNNENDNNNNNNNNIDDQEEEEEEHIKKERKSPTQDLPAKPPPGPIVSNGIIDFPLQPVVQQRLICTLCSGYYRDPHTVTECLHTFCKSCLFFQFRSGYRRCPECDTPLGPDPFREVLSDRTIQELVDKIFPDLKDLDEKEENHFYSRRGIRLKKEFREEMEKNAEKEGNAEGGRNISKKGHHQSADALAGVSGSAAASVEGGASTLMQAAHIPPDELNFNMIPDPSADTNSNSQTSGEGSHGNASVSMPPLLNPQLRTSGRLKIVTLKKYLIKKLHLKAAPSSVEILCNGDPLGDELSLTFVRRTRWLHPSDDLTLSYRFGEEVLY